MKRIPKRRWTVRCAICIERGRTAFDPESASSVPLYSRALGGSPRFLHALEPPALPQILNTVHQGILEARKGATEGFTICPVVTESVRFRERESELRVVFCTSLWTFMAPGARTRSTPLEDLCQEYFFRVFLPFVGSRLLKDLESRNPPSLSESECAQALDRALRELSARFPLALHQARYAEELGRTGNPQAARTHVVKRMLREARSQIRIGRPTRVHHRRSG